MEIDFSETSFFNTLTDKQMDLLKRFSFIQTYPANSYIFMEGDSSNLLYIILEGKIKIFKNARSGKEKILAILKEGDFLGEMGVIENKSRSASAISTSKCKLLSIEGKEFIKFLDSNSEIALKIITELSRRLRRANQDIELLTFYDVETRLKAFFKRVSADFIKNKQEEILLEKFTHYEIADHIGTSRETVTRIINKMIDNGFIEINDENIILKKIKDW